MCLAFNICVASHYLYVAVGVAERLFCLTAAFLPYHACRQDTSSLQQVSELHFLCKWTFCPFVPFKIIFAHYYISLFYGVYIHVF